jgi:ankyrin repeat protein
MARDGHGRTPYDIARRHGRTEVADLLRARGAHDYEGVIDALLRAGAQNAVPSGS